MLHLLREGDRVKVWPRPGHVVHSEPAKVLETPSGVELRPGRVLPPEGAEVVWSAWLVELARSGSLFFSDPRHESEGGPEGSGGIRHAEHVHPQSEALAKPSADAKQEG